MSNNTALVILCLAGLLFVFGPVVYMIYDGGQTERACIHEHGTMVNNVCEFPRR